MRLLGYLLISIGVLMFILAPPAYYFLAAFACGMNTTGCRDFSIDWLPAIATVGPILLVAAAIISGGRRLTRR